MSHLPESRQTFPSCSDVGAHAVGSARAHCSLRVSLVVSRESEFSAAFAGMVFYFVSTVSPLLALLRI